MLHLELQEQELVSQPDLPVLVQLQLIGVELVAMVALVQVVQQVQQVQVVQRVRPLLVAP